MFAKGSYWNKKMNNVNTDIIPAYADGVKSMNTEAHKITVVQNHTRNGTKTHLLPRFSQYGIHLGA